MIDQDEKALSDQLVAGMDIETLQVLFANQPAEDPDQTRIFCRWTIEAGDGELVQSDGAMLQLGIATLQIIAPSQTWTDDAHAVRDHFFALFRNWRSDDRCLRVYRQTSTQPPQPNCYQVNCRIFWESRRRP